MQETNKIDKQGFQAGNCFFLNNYKKKGGLLLSSNPPTNNQVYITSFRPKHCENT